MSSIDLSILGSIKSFIHLFDLFGISTGGYILSLLASSIAIGIMDIRNKVVRKR